MLLAVAKQGHVQPVGIELRVDPMPIVGVLAG
jgi:hypothetical protein